MKLFLLFFSLVCLSLPKLQAQETTALQVGDKAPQFSLPYATRDSVSREKISLSDMVGKRTIILAFYPADWSGGCTKEMCTMRDNFSDLSKLDANIFGISGDYAFSHHEWAKSLNLPFVLLSDHQHTVAKQYLSYNDETGFNKRTVYVVDTSGKIAYIDKEYHAGDPQSFEKLQKALAQIHQ